MSHLVPLALVHQAEINQSVLQHVHVKHAMKLLEDVDSMRGRVIKTNKSSRKVEIYGWGRNISEHIDGEGYTYIMPINPGKTVIHVTNRASPVPGDEFKLVIKAGDIIRLDDRWHHWTEDTRKRLALFLGCYKRPNDQDAIKKMTEAIDLLKGGWASAPNVIGMYR